MKKHFYIGALIACLITPASAISAEITGAQGNFVSSETSSLLGLPALTSRGVKVGHVVKASVTKDGTLEKLIVDTSSSGSPYLDGILQFDGGATDVSKYRVLITMSAAQSVE